MKKIKIYSNILRTVAVFTTANQRVILFFVCLSLVSFLSSCEQDALPKPYGDVRLQYPEAEYQEFVSQCPYTFQYSTLAFKKPKDLLCAYDLYYSKLKATIYLTYEEIPKEGIVGLIKDAEKAVYEPHTKRAEYIDPKLIVRDKDKVYGTLYELGGESAMNFQFHVTDSTQHFLRGSVYFRSHPKPDSLAPAVDYIRKDVEKLMETVRWK